MSPFGDLLILMMMQGSSMGDTNSILPLLMLDDDSIDFKFTHVSSTNKFDLQLTRKFDRRSTRGPTRVGTREGERRLQGGRGDDALGFVARLSARGGGRCRNSRVCLVHIHMSHGT